jgi:LuxR family transcriptional regulator, maltose regulon positive regulatory protein
MTAPRAARFSAPFPIAEAKIRPIAPRAGTVARPHLVRLLAEPLRPPVASVIAPPGYGKTTLLAQWTATERRPVAWVTLDSLDNDPARLLTCIAAACDAIGPVDEAIAAALSGSSDRVVATAVPRLLSSLNDWNAPAALVLDDVHLLVERASLDAVSILLAHLPPGFRVALAGRSAPELPLARLRAERSLVDIGPRELAFDEVETATLAAAAGCRLRPDEIRDLLLRTEGWATGIDLEVQRRTRADGEPCAARHATGGDPGDERYVAAYLRSEVIDDLDDEDVRVLTRTSILDTVTPAAADAVAALPFAGQRVSRLARHHLLIQEVDGAEVSYRYHHLLRDFLATELERREPDASIDLHGRAAAWYAESGDTELAIEHARLGSDGDLAARLVVAAAVRAYGLGQITTVARWVTGFEPAAFHRHPPLAVVAAWVHMITGSPERADAMANVADRATFDGPPGDGSASFASQRAILRSAMVRHGPRDALATATWAASQELPDSPWRPHLLQSLGTARLALDDLDGAEEAYDEALVAGDGRPSPTTLAVLAKQASIRIRRGDWEGADGLLRRLREQHPGALDDGTVTSLIVYAVSARIAIHRGELDRGRDELVHAQLVRPLASHAIPLASVAALLELARAYLAISDPGGAQLVLREAEAIVRRRPMLGTLTTDVMDLRRRLAGAAATLAGSSTLTAAELRVLPLLPTYLSFQDIADRLAISRNTVKTHAMSIYGKLWASSRGEAVERAVELGLLEPYPGLEIGPEATNGPGGPDR